MKVKKWITLLLVFCLVLGNIAPAAGAVTFGPEGGVGGNGSGWFDGLLESAEKLLGINLRDDKSHLQNLDENVLSLVGGKWMATTADGKTFELKEAQLPKHIQVLRKAAGEYQPMDVVTAFVVLKDAPTAESYKSIAAVPQEETARLLAKQDALLSAIGQQVGQVDVVNQFTHLTNAIVIRTAFGNLEKIAAVSGVSNVFLNPTWEACSTKAEAQPFTISSADMSYVTQVWHDLGYTGQGMTVAILDTGLDVDHPAFEAAPAGAVWTAEALQQKLDELDLNMEALYEAAYKTTISAGQLYYNEKVPFTFNYATGTTNVTHNDGLGDHGTHVAGIAAANAVEGSNVSGMAPDAQIFAMKVFHPQGGAGMDTIVAALEDCMKLGVDVVNMSLGSACGFSESGDEEVDSIFRRISESDMIVDVAVGNEGNSSTMTKWGLYTLPTIHIDNGSVASPSTYANAMGVASVDNVVIAADYFALADGTEIFYQYSIEFMYGETPITMIDLKDLGNLDYVVIEGVGNPEDFYDENGKSIVEGKVALIKRGEIQFGEKALNAQAAGAVAAIIWNVDDSDVFGFGMTTAVQQEDGSEIIPDIPVCLITLSDGQKMADAEKKVMVVPGDYSFREDKRGGQMSSFSCWGTSGDLRLVPDLSGVGGNVYSTLDGGIYGLMSGTSMACPQVAGVTTLVLQYLKETFPEATDAEIRMLADSLLMSTATTVIDVDTGLEASPRQQGAGLVNAMGAITAQAYLTVAGSDRPKAELGDSEEGVFTFTFYVHNYSDAPKTYTLRSSLLCEDYELNDEHPGVYFLAEQEHKLDESGVSFTRDTVTVAPGTSEEITVTIQLTEADKEWINTYFPSGNYVEGFVYLEDENEVTLSLPFLGFFQRWDAAPLYDTGFWYEEGMWELPGATHTATQYYHLLWTSLGATPNDWMLGLNPYMEAVELDENGNMIAIRPYSPSNNVLSPNGDGVLDQISEIYISLMRNCAEMDLVYTDAEGNVLHQEKLYKDHKTMYISGYGSVIPMVYSWYYEDLYDFAGLEDGDVVYLSVSGRIDYPGAETDVLFDKLPIYIDTSAPVMDTESIVEMSTEEGNFIQLTFAEAHPAAAILTNRSGSQIYHYYGEDQMIDNGDGTYTVTLDVTGLGEELTVVLGDFGCNEVYYDLSYTLTENNPSVDKDALYAYQVFDEVIYAVHGWDYMFGWTTIDRETGEVEMISSDAYEYYALVAAEYVDGYVFAVDAGYNFVYMVPGLWNRVEICNLGVNVMDMAWDDVTNTMYVCTKTETGLDYPTHNYGLYTLDIMTGKLTEIVTSDFYYNMPHAMTFVDGKLYCAISNRVGFFEVDTKTGKVSNVQVDGQNFLPQNSQSNNTQPQYSQSMTYSKADGKIYWAFYGEVSDLIVIDPSDWSYTTTNFGADREYVGMLTMEEDDDYHIPASKQVTRVVISDSEVLLQKGQQYSLSVNLLPWNAPVLADVVWSSSNEEVATVDQDGNVVAVGDGVATITAAYGKLKATCEVVCVEIKGNLYAYNFYSGTGSGDWLDIDLDSMTAESLYPSPVDFIAADYNGHDGFIYGYDSLGQGYRFDPVTGKCEALGTTTGVQLLDMTYDYSSGTMYAMSFSAADNASIIYYVNLYTGALVEAGKAYEALLTLASDANGKLYGISSSGTLFGLKRVKGDLGGGGIAPLSAEQEEIYSYELKEIMKMPVSGMQYAQSMCYDHNNQVFLWANPETGNIFWIKPGEYTLSMGEPTGTGLIEYTGLYVIPENMPALQYTAVEKIAGADILVLTDCRKLPAVNCFPLNATNQAGIIYTSADESIATVQDGLIVGVSLGTTTITATLVDEAPDGTQTTHSCTFQVTVKQSTDNIYGYLVQDVTHYNSYAWIEMDDANPAIYELKDYVYDGTTGIMYTLYSAEYVDGLIYAYGFNDQDWQANFQFIIVNPKTWSIVSVRDMGDEFPFVYDMAFDYTTGTLYAVAGSTTASSLYIVNMASGSLIECMTYKQFFMSLAIDREGTLYAMEISKDISDPLDFMPIYSNAKLYTLDVEAGTTTLFMDTGVKSNQLSSMAYDYDTGYIYWTGFYMGNGGYTTGLHLIDPSDKSCHNLGTIGGHSQVTGLMILADNYPQVPSDLQNVMMIQTMLETNIGETVATDLFMVPATAEVEVEWISADPSVATVDENGVITGVSAGITTITAKVEDNGKVFQTSCTVHVYLPEEDYFLIYNRDDHGFSAIDRTDPNKVTNLTEGVEEELLRAMEMVNGVLYAYDEEGNFFIVNVDDNYSREMLGSHGIAVEAERDEVRNYGDYTYYYHYEPNFEIRDMAWDPVNNRMLVLACSSEIKSYYYYQESKGYTSETYVEELEYEGGCRIYEADLKTGALTEVSRIYGESGKDYSGVYALTVTDQGQVYVYSTYLDFICSMDMETGVISHLATFQNLGYYGDSDCAPMSMTYDPATNHIYVLFTQNGNAYFLFKYNVTTTMISKMGNIGTEHDDCAGLIINRHSHAYTETAVDATCTTDGHIHYECACGHYYDEVTQEATGHNLVDGKCEHCGIEVGDVNGDGRINSRDARQLLRYLAGMSSENEQDLGMADYNGDGRINVRDARAILAYLAGIG